MDKRELFEIADVCGVEWGEEYRHKNSLYYVFGFPCHYDALKFVDRVNSSVWVKVIQEYDETYIIAKFDHDDKLHFIDGKLTDEI